MDTFRMDKSNLLKIGVYKYKSVEIKISFLKLLMRRSVKILTN